VWGQDWTRFHEPAPSAVLFARDLSQLSQVIKYCHDHQIAVVPSGGRTGLAGGAVACEGEVVVSFDRMAQISNFDSISKTVDVEAGVVTANLQQFAVDQGLMYPVDFASSGSSQVGGNIATNAGGIKVLRYGLTRAWVQGLTAVTGTGEVLELNRGLVKNATGYDLRHLFIGSEGTLGLITSATMQLAEAAPDLDVMVLAVPRMQDTISVLSAFQEKVKLTAFEFFSDIALKHVCKHRSLAKPVQTSSAYYVLLECETSEQVHEAFEDCVAKGWVIDGVLGASEAQRVQLWQYREGISESITPFTPYKNDLSVRVSDVPQFLAAAEACVGERYPGFEIVWFGHIGDGNLHLNILKPASLAVAEFKAQCEQVSEEVLGIVADFDGSVSAEHGVGLLKREQLHYSRSREELALMQGLKKVFDPAGIMNPGKLLRAPMAR
jgi:FAD/FMN-containing dehydrogenase